MFLKIVLVGLAIVGFTTAHKGYQLLFGFGPQQHTNGSALPHLAKSGAMMILGWLAFALCSAWALGCI